MTGISSHGDSGATLAFDPAQGYPAGRHVRYECLICGVNLASIPAHAESCRCENIVVDVDAGRISVKVPAQMTAYETPSSCMHPATTRTSPATQGRCPEASPSP